jgi:GntR family transcriptional regulator
MNLNVKGKSMVYIELADQYKRYISLGILKYGEKLPSVRSLASELGINPNTVNKSYQLLEDQGYIKTYPKKGAYVVYFSGDANGKMDYWREQLSVLKESGLTRETLEVLITELYEGGKQND